MNYCLSRVQTLLAKSLYSALPVSAKLMLASSGGTTSGAFCSSALPLAKQVEVRLEQAALTAKAVVIKLKYGDFRTITRCTTLPYLLISSGGLQREAEKLLRGLELGTGVRLLGVGVQGLSVKDAEVVQTFLFPPSV